jgi:hypothetical protein
MIIILYISCGIVHFILYIMFHKGLEMGSDKIHAASCTYVHFLSLCHLYPLKFTWRITNENFQKIPFLAKFFSQLCT